MTSSLSELPFFRGYRPLSHGSKVNPASLLRQHPAMIGEKSPFHQLLLTDLLHPVVGEIACLRQLQKLALKDHGC